MAVPIQFAILRAEHFNNKSGEVVRSYANSDMPNSLHESIFSEYVALGSSEQVFFPPSKSPTCSCMIGKS